MLKTKLSKMTQNNEVGCQCTLHCFCSVMHGMVVLCSENPIITKTFITVSIYLVLFLNCYSCNKPVFLSTKVTYLLSHLARCTLGVSF